MSELPDQRPPPADAVAETVQRKLQESLLLRLAGRAAIRWRADLIGYRLHTWTHEALLAGAAAGISHPLLSVATGSGAQRSPASPSVWEAFRAYPDWVVALLALFAAGWLGLRAWVGLWKLDQRGPQLLACARELGSIESDLEAVLADPDPLPGLVELVARSKEVVDRYYRADLWPWPIGPEGWDERVAERARRLRRRFEGNWRRS